MLTRELPNDYFPGLENSASMYSQMILGTIAYVASYKYLEIQPWYEENTSLAPGNEWTLTGDAVSVMFFVTNILFTFSIIGFYVSLPFKKRIYKSYGLAIYQTFTMIYNSLIVIYTDSQVSLMDISKSVNNDSDFRVRLFLLCCLFCILILII